MFGELNKKLDKQATDKPAEPAKPVQALTVIDAVTERLENVIEEVKKPNIVEHHHRYTISIASNWFFLSWVALVLIILGSFWAIGNQRQTISQYKENDLKYRYIKVQG
jgi:hypothetical protein